MRRDLDRQRRDDYGQKFGIERLYEDLETMLKTERPGVLHIVTPPGIREAPIELAGRYGVKRAMLAAVRGEKVNLPAAVDDDVVARLKKELTK